MTCSVNHSTITTKFCSVCGAPATTAQAPAQPPQWNQPPAAAPQWNQPPAAPYVPQPTFSAPQQNYGAPGANGYAFPFASTGKRVGAFALDMLFLTVTCGLAGIWALVVMKDGQTPGKQVLKMRVYATTTGRPATWGHMAIRNILIPLVPSLLFVFAGIASLVYEGSYDYYYDYYTATDYSTALNILSWFVWAVLKIVDLVMISNSPTMQGIKDKLAKTVVLDESFR